MGRKEDCLSWVEACLQSYYPSCALPSPEAILGEAVLTWTPSRLRRRSTSLPIALPASIALASRALDDQHQHPTVRRRISFRIGFRETEAAHPWASNRSIRTLF